MTMCLLDRLRLACLCSLLAFAAPPVLADGAHFFGIDVSDKPLTPNSLIYSGNIKDTQGRYVDGVEVIVNLTAYGPTIRVMNDRPGHWRSPDLFAWLQEAGGGKINPERVSIEAKKAGYRLARPVAVPLRAKGQFNIDILLEPGNPVPASGPTAKR